MIDCSTLPRHLRKICTGEYRQANGRPHSAEHRLLIVAKYLRRDPKSIELPSPVLELPKTQSQVGTRLHEIVEREAGRIECGECRDEISRLNLMTTQQVLAEKNAIAAGMVLRAQKKAPKFWQRWGARLAPAIATSQAVKWIEEACGGEMNWQYGVTTVPWRKTEFLRSLKSLQAAGFATPRIFVDGPQDAWYQQFGLPVTFRGDNIKTASHWILSAQELFYREPEADRYAIFQDDVVYCGGLKQYLSESPYPHDGYLNLFTFFENEPLIAEQTGWVKSNQKGQGALALVFNREAMVSLLSSPHLLTRTWSRKRHFSIDGGIVTALQKAGVTEYVHSPSLVQHFGHKSSMGNSPPKGMKQSLAKTFPGEDFNALELR
jgi:hypothetical protein